MAAVADVEPSRDPVIAETFFVKHGELTEVANTSVKIWVTHGYR